MSLPSSDYTSHEGPISGDDEGDEISTSSSSSEVQESYEIERIIAEHEEQGQKFFLVKWKGYADFRCTWEPQESFDSEETFIEWEKQKQDGDSLDAEQVQALELRMSEYLDNKESRKKRRQLRREKKVHKDQSLDRVQARSQSGQRRQILSTNGQEQASQKRGLTKKVVKDSQSLAMKRRQSIVTNDTPRLHPPQAPPFTSLQQPAPFHGIDGPLRARQTKHKHNNHALDSTNPRAGQMFRSLSHANNFNVSSKLKFIHLLQG
jgi:Chromo (CHRromatin Organisation MOdifier) domain